MVLHGNGLDHEAELIVNPAKHTISSDVKEKRQKEKRHEKVLAGCRGWHGYVLAGCRGWHRYSVLPHSHLSERTRDGHRGHIGRSRGLALDQPPLLRRSYPTVRSAAFAAREVATGHRADRATARMR